MLYINMFSNVADHAYVQDVNRLVYLPLQCTHGLTMFNMTHQINAISETLALHCILCLLTVLESTKS